MRITTCHQGNLYVSLFHGQKDVPTNFVPKMLLLYVLHILIVVILDIYIWVCLKMEYTPNYSHLVGIMIINHWVWGYTIFRQTHITSPLYGPKYVFWYPAGPHGAQRECFSVRGNVSYKRGICRCKTSAASRDFPVARVIAASSPRERIIYNI